MKLSEFSESDILRLKASSSWIHSDGWLTNDLICSWYGVLCQDGSEENNIIVELDLKHNGLQGNLPMSELMTLRTHLRKINLAGNAIQKLAGRNDESFFWPHLQSLLLQDNRISGTQPFSWLQNFPNITEINLSANRFNDSHIPGNVFENFSSVRTLRLDHNFIGGSLPSTLASLESLGELQ